MTVKILVAYASKHGATAEIAGKIGEVLTQDGFEVDVMPANHAGDLAQYNAVVLGSAAYIGQWRKEAVKFIRNNENTLAGMSAWLFTSGPTGEGDPVELLQGWRYPGKIQSAIDHIKPRDIAVFHGALDVNKLNFFEKFILKMVKAPVSDFRDWDTINSWAKAIATEMKKEEQR